MEKIFTREWLGRPLTIKTGLLARQADAAVTVQYGDTVVLAAVVEEQKEREGIDFFPLMVDFEERFYAAGIIKGSRWIKREGRPSDEAVLTGRMIDRAIRPFFNQSSRRDVQVTMIVLSADHQNDHDIVALIAASAALAFSPVEWRGPISGVRVGRKNGQLIFNPTYEERLESDLDLIVAGTGEKVIMIEAGAREMKEEDVYAAITAAQAALSPLIDFINQAKKEIAIKAKVVKDKTPSDESERQAQAEKEKVLVSAANWLKDNIAKTLFDQVYYTKGERKAAVAAIKENLEAFLRGQGIGRSLREVAVKELVEAMVEAEVTRAILAEKRRVDGRPLDGLRPLAAIVGVLPRNHGSGLFQRGETQVLSIATLAGPGLAQALEGIEGTGEKRYMHHYNFPPYATAEAKPLRSAGRREIGHGALAEKALLPVLPAKEDFPYVIRVVSETLSSNGSSSMASTCGSSLALMDAGVPIKKAVAGIAMGLASNEDLSQYEILTDLQDLEDGPGGMDFKIAGTADGITAIQLDTKTAGLTKEIIEKTLAQGKKARLEILAEMNRAISAPRPDLSPYAPRITSFYINPEKIREVIGPGGKVINEIVAQTGVTIDIEDDGLVMVCGTDAAKAAQAVKWVNDIVREVEVGETFTGKVVRILDFGAFVEILPNRDGMVHVSQLAPYRVEKPDDFLALGDVVTVKVKEIDEQGRVNLTMLGLPENEALWAQEKGKSKGPIGDRFNGPRRPDRFNGPRRSSNGRGSFRH